MTRVDPDADGGRMSEYRRQIAQAIQATIFHSPTSYSWLGRRSAPPIPAVKRALTPQTARRYLLYVLRDQLYSDFYAPGRVVPARREIDAAPPGMTPFVQALSAANAGAGRWEPNWRVESASRAAESPPGGEAPGDALRVSRDGLELRVGAGEWLALDGAPPLPGALVGVRFPKEHLGISPGFYMALGDQPLAADTATLVRLYWRLAAEAAVPFVSSATRILNDARLSFKLKIVNDPAAFDRCDAAVIYLARQDFALAAEPMGALYGAVAASLGVGAPAFTKRLAPGLALAEDPPSGESFGLSRCGLLADGLLDAYERGATTDVERLRVVEARFARAGLRLDAPFLNAGSRDTYDLPLPLPARTRRALRSAATRARGAGSDDGSHSGTEDGWATGAMESLRVAVTIGRRLAQDAIWHDGRCTWIGVDPEPMPAPRGARSIVYTSLGPDLYAGDSGVAWFLAELHVSTGDAESRRVALGAIRRALAQVGALGSLSRLGLYAGQLGVALAAARIGLVLGEDEVVERARALARGALQGGPEAEFDLIAGAAGAIVALLALRIMLDDASLVAAAARLGDELVRSAQTDAKGASWKAVGARYPHNLTGLSHGTAGAGYALLELFVTTGEARYRQAAERAFDYERHWFDAGAGNWPDFRVAAGERGRKRSAYPCATNWCHGAPGITLSRLRAVALLGADACRAEAIAGSRTTQAALEACLAAGTENYSLCHGLTGAAEVLAYAAEVLPEVAEGRRLAHAVAQTGARAYASRAADWPCGVPAGQTPCLMLGLAGIGYFYLRLHDPTKPSVLLVQPEQFRPSRACAAPRTQADRA